MTGPRRIHLFVAFAFTVMADPVSSVTYAVESALHGLNGDLSTLFPTMAAIIAIIAVVSATYDHLIRRFPSGGGGHRVLRQRSVRTGPSSRSGRCSSTSP